MDIPSSLSLLLPTTSYFFFSFLVFSLCSGWALRTHMISRDRKVTLTVPWPAVPYTPVLQLADAVCCNLPR